MIMKKEVITISCGIGRSFEETVAAMRIAKKIKGEEKYNIKIYKGERLRSKLHEVFKQRAKEYFELSNALTNDQKKILENFSLRDPLTGLLNKIGFVLKLEELKRLGINSGYYILFDLDDLHYWNQKIGYSKVDKYIEEIGKVIISNIRQRDNKLMSDLVGHRLNESAGDEFLIFIPSEESEEKLEEIKIMSKRIIDKINEAQLKIPKTL